MKAEKSKLKKSVFFRTFQLLKHGKKHYFFFQLVYALITFLCLIPIGTWLARVSLKFSGYSYLTTNNLASFLLKPVTIVSVVFFFILFGFFVLWEISLVMSFLLVGKKVEKKPGIYIFLSSFRKTCFCFRKRNFKVILLAYLFAVTSNTILIYGIFTKTRIPRYIVSSIAHLPEIQIGMAAVILIFCVISYRNLFTLPYFLLEGKSLKDSRKSSDLLRKGNGIYAIFHIVVFNIAVVLISIAVYYFVLTLEALFVAMFIPRNTAIATYLSLVERAKVYVAIFLCWFGIYCNLGLLVELFLRFKKENDEQYRTDDIRLTARFFSERDKRIIFCVIAVFLFIGDALYSYDSVLRGGSGVLAGFEGTKITAHRGSSYEAPENSVPAVLKAIENLADYAEIDVQETKDGEIILMHDANLYRTAGVNEFVWNMTYEEMKDLDIGSWFSEEYRGTKIPTLREVLEVCKGKIRLNIEIKSNGKAPDIEKKVVDLIDEYDFERQCVVQSINYSEIKKIKEFNPSIRTGHILMAAVGSLEDKVYADFFNVKSTFINSMLVESAHKDGKEVHAWTVNTRNEIRRMKVLKVDNIITDRPILAREILYEENFNKSISNLLKLVK